MTDDAAGKTREFAFLRAGAAAVFRTAAPRFGWRQVGLGLAIVLPIVGLAIGLTDVLDPQAPPPPLFTPGAALWARLAYFAAAAVCLYLAALSEEMLFRGWAL